MTYAGCQGAVLGALAVIDSRTHISPRSVRFLEALGKLPQRRYADLDDAIARALTGTAPQSLVAHLAAARCPILAVRGARSAIVDASGLADFATARPDAELAEIPDAHHHVMLDQPAALTALLGGFLDRRLKDHG
jgi:pimeloyl-ACP methyl ester carboxylesterase